MNRTLGATLMIAGTTAGGGILAMPLTAAGIGFFYTTLLLIIIWLFLNASALLFIEVHQNFPKDYSQAMLAKHYFGKFGNIFINIVYCVLMYALLSAYITGGSSLVGMFMPEMVGKSSIAIILFTGFIGLFVIIGTKTVDFANRIFFSLKVFLFFAMVFIFIPNITLANLSALPINYLYMLSATPVFFTSFGFHVIIPTLVNYLDRDIKKLKLSVISGTTIPLIIYILWQISIQGVLDQHSFYNLIKQYQNLDGLIYATKEITGSQLLEKSILYFSSTTVLTSFLGVSLGLFDSLKSVCKKNKYNNRVFIGAYTFIPAMIVALFYPKGFIIALGYAGMLFVILGVFLPVMLAWKNRKAHPNNEYQVWGGNFLLVLIFLMGILILLIPQLISFGYLPSVFS